MRYQVTGKQPNSKLCLVCGLKNDFGLHASFYELENQELLAVFTAMEEHQSYPGRLHGGIATAILDETIGRAIMMRNEGEIWGVTVELNVFFKKPIPLQKELRVIGRITADAPRYFEGTGEILLPDGQVAAHGWGKYVKLPLDRIADFDVETQEWRVNPTENDPTEVEL
jgi:uncharacterized protein (TIGR00369 family)